MTTAPVTICFPFVGDSLGGSHISAVTLVKSLDPARFRPLVVVHEEGPLTRYLSEQGLSYRALPLPRYVGRDGSLLGHVAALLVTVPRLLRFIRQENVAAVHSNDGRMHQTWCLPARLAGRAAIWHQRNLFSGSRLEALLLSCATRVIAISRFVAASLPRRVAGKTVVIDNPFERPPDLDRGACHEALCAELGVDAKSRVVGFFGNLIAWKRPLVFVEMAARLAQSSDLPLVFVMFGEDREGFIPRIGASLADRGLEGRVFLLGFRSPVWPWMAACDLLVAPAEAEPFGRTLVEAMLCGTPVVAADAGGHREIIEDGVTGRLVPPGDAAALAQAAAELLGDDHLRARLVDNAAAAAQCRFGTAEHGDAVAEIYAAATGDRRAAASDKDKGLALVIADLSPGGAQRVLCLLANAWAEAGRKVTLISLDDGDNRFFALDRRIQRVALRRQYATSSLLTALWANLLRILALRRAIRACGAERVLSFVAATNVLTLCATRGLDCKVAVSERNDPKRQSLGRIWEWARRLTYPRSDLVVVNSAAAFESLSRHVEQSRLARLPNPIDMTAGKETCGARQPIILAVGRLHRQKGFDLLLEAFARSAARTAGWRLAVIGEGPLRDELHSLSEELAIADAVEWLGLERDPFAHYARAGIFVMPSRYEGTPNAVLEAMASSLPVIVTDRCGGALEFVQPEASGLVVPADDSAALTAAIDRLAADPTLRARLGEAGRESVRATAIDRVLPLWDAALEGRWHEGAASDLAAKRNTPIERAAHSEPDPLGTRKIG